MKTTKFVRKPMYVDAVQVTHDNFQEVAAWCGGKAERIKEGSIYIKVLDNRSKLVPRTKAFVGDWVLEGYNGYRVYTNLAFEKAFERIPDKMGSWPNVDDIPVQLVLDLEKEEGA